MNKLIQIHRNLFTVIKKNYNFNINHIQIHNNEDKLIMETLIKCFKGKDCKNIPIELL